MKSERYNVVQLPNKKGDTVPDYMRDVTLQEIYNYFFNWHTELQVAPETQVREWYQKKGWTWTPL